LKSITLTELSKQTITPQLMANIRAQFRLDWHGIHGANHWARVMHHGLSLSEVTGADTRVTRLFAVLHDSQRHDDYADPEHGDRAATYAYELHKEGLIDLPSRGLDLLMEACRFHSDGRRDADITIQTCWDSDRLDLGRVGIRPDPKYLCTSAATDPERIERAWRWSRSA
jgi:uncharacterized protein